MTKTPAIEFESYAVHGEDLIIDHILQNIGIFEPSYLDLGCNDPIYNSLTYRMYRSGRRGVCVEADPVLCRKFAAVRPRDTVLNCAVTDTSDTTIPYYSFGPGAGMNTCLPDEAQVRSEAFNLAPSAVINVDCINIVQLISKHLHWMPDVVIVDLEGFDERVMRNFPFSMCRPVIFCIEVAELSTHWWKTQNAELITLMQNAGYACFADVNVNMIFVDTCYLPQASQQ